MYGSIVKVISQLNIRVVVIDFTLTHRPTGSEYQGQVYGSSSSHNNEMRFSTDIELPRTLGKVPTVNLENREEGGREGTQREKIPGKLFRFSVLF